MKVEVVCKNLKCPTRIDRAQPQLVTCHKLRLGSGRKIPVDEDSNPIGCPWCNMAVEIDRISSDQAQFALGQVSVLDDARETLDKDDNWLEESSVMLAWHIACHHGSVTSEILQRNAEIISLLPFSRTTDQIVSQYFKFDSITWVITTPAYGTTEVLGRKSMERRVGS